MCTLILNLLTFIQDHPNIIRIVDAYKEPKFTYIVEELAFGVYIDIGTLKIAKKLLTSLKMKENLMKATGLWL